MADALDTHGSLLRASAALGVGQPALTRALQELEEIAGTRLFERHARGVRPTEQGVVLIRLARRVLAEIRRADEALDGAPTTLAIGVLPVAAVGVLPGVLIRLQATQPALRLRITEGRMEELLPLLAAREIDLIIGRLYAPAVPDAFTREALWEEPISILARAGHPVLRGRATPTRLARHSLVLPTISQRVGQETDRLLTQLGLSAEGALRTSSYGLIRELLLASDHIAVMPRSMMVGDLARGALRVVALPVDAAPRPAGLVLPADPPPGPAVTAFVGALRAHLATLSRHMPKADTSARRNDKTARPARR